MFNCSEPNNSDKMPFSLLLCLGVFGCSGDLEMTNTRKGALQEGPSKPDPRFAEETRRGDEGDRIPDADKTQPAAFLEHVL